jgi:hypothetical protein
MLFKKRFINTANHGMKSGYQAMKKYNKNVINDSKKFAVN